MYTSIFNLKTYLISIISIFSLHSIVLAQTFDLEQVEQIFRPRVKVESRYIFDSKFTDTISHYNQKDANVLLTFPIKSKFDANIKLDLSSLKLKDILKNSVRIKASQLMGTLRFGAKNNYIGFDTLPNKQLYTATAGIMGVHLTKKYRILFYSLTGTIAEQDKTINKFVPRVSGVLGQLHLRGLKKNFFYGLAATYSDGYFLPAPFLGGSEPIGKHFIFNYTLPANINLQYKTDKKLIATIGVNLDGYRTGIEYQKNRINLNYTNVAAYGNVKYKFSKTLQAKIEGGYIVYQNLKYTNTDITRVNFPLQPGPYIQANFSVLLGKSVWEKITGKLFENL